MRDQIAFRLGCIASVALSLGLATAGLAQTDAMLGGDFIDPATGEAAQLQPGLPWFQPGPDGRFGNQDDVIDFGVVGDIDIVVRAGINSISGSIPSTAPNRGTGIPVGTAGAFGSGVSIPFIVIASDGATSSATGSPVAPASLEGAAVLVMAFPDLDGDGYVGVTNLDGDPNDAALEEAELDPVGRRFSFFSAGQAVGELHVGTGGPMQAELTVILTASAFSGPRSPEYFGGQVSEGPVVMTRLPFWPRTDPDQVLEGNPPEPPSVNGLVGVSTEDEFTPDPDAAYGEAFTIPTDGSVPSVDVAVIRSGNFVSFGLARPLDVAIFNPDASSSVRIGRDDTSGRMLLELVDGFAIGTGAGNDSTLRVVPLDERSNVTDLHFFRDTLLVASGGVSITSPNTDQDPLRETIRISSAAGAMIELSGDGTLLTETLPTPVCGRGWSLAVLTTLAIARRRGGKRATGAA